MRGNLGEILQHGLNLLLADPADEILKALALLPIPEIAICDPEYHFRDPFRGDRPNREPIGVGIIFQLSAQHDLEMRHRVAIDISANAVKAYVGYMVLTA